MWESEMWNLAQKEEQCLQMYSSSFMNGDN